MNWVLLFLLLVIVGTGRAESPDDAVKRGRMARADGVPQAALHDLRRAASSAPGAAAKPVVVELLRCLIASDREAEALEWSGRPEWRDDPEVTFWRAQAQAQRGEWETALADYRRAAAEPALAADAQFGAARMLEAMGRSFEALRAYRSIPPGSRWNASAQLAAAAILVEEGEVEEARAVLQDLRVGDKARGFRNYLLARIALQAGDLDEAKRLYEELSVPGGPFAAGAAIGLAEIAARRGQLERAEAILEAHLGERARGPALRDVLAKLDEVRAQLPDPSNARLRAWERDEQNRSLAAGAAFYLARGDERQGRTDRAERNYRDFLKRYPHDPLRAAASIRLANLLLARGEVEEAVAVIAAAPPGGTVREEARRKFVRGATEYRRDRHGEAPRLFVDAAGEDPALATPALQNAALAAMAAGDDALVREILSALRKESPPVAHEIELAQALQSAGRGHIGADRRLEELARPASSVAHRARLALAEWRWAAGDLPAAKREFQRVANGAPNPQADYFAVHLADDGSKAAADPVGTAARAFLERNPQSPHETEVRMKWGEVLARSGDFRGARVQFEQAAAAAPDAVGRSSALFLAARAAAASMDPAELEAAIALLEEVVGERESGLAIQARWEQAKLQSALGRPAESVRILDSLLSTAKDPRIEMAARLKRGDAVLELSRKEPDRFEEAATEWRAVADNEKALPAERNEALVHLGSAAEQAGDTDRALAAYYEVLNGPRDRQPEYFWYYKAGFEAAQLLLARDRIAEAVAIYEKMAAAPGPRAQEARERVKRLRLENLIWEE